jgi:hypothetical protein
MRNKSSPHKRPPPKPSAPEEFTLTSAAERLGISPGALLDLAYGWTGGAPKPVVDVLASRLEQARRRVQLARSD